MKALLKMQTGEGFVELKNWEEPSVGKREVKIKVMAVGICGTDLKIREGHAWSNPPVILGHELSGIVVDVGEDVSGVKIGQRVVCETAQVICGNCYYCRSGNYLMCDKRLSIGYGVNGGMAEYIVVREDIIHELPDDVPFSDGAMCEPLAVAVHAVYDTVDVKSTDIALISGCGAIGLLVAQVVRSLGARVIITGIDADEPRFELAKQLGIEYTVNTQKEDIVDYVKKVTGGVGVDIAYDCSGAPVAIRSDMTCLKKKGTLVQIGLTKPSFEIEYSLLTAKEISLRGTFGHKWESWNTALKLISLGKVRTAPLVSHHFTLDDWEEGFRVAKNLEGIKVMIHPNGICD